MPHSAHDQYPSTSAESCPYCGHEITHGELVKIESRIAKEQQEKFEAQAKQLNAKHLGAMSEIRKELAEKDNAVKAQLEVANKTHQLELAAKEKSAKAAAEVARKAEREKMAKEQADAVEKLANEKKAIEDEREKLEADKETQRKVHEKELDKQRKILNEDHEKKILAQKAAAEKDSLRMQSKLADMTRQLEKKSNEELGDGAEVDLYNDLKAAFPDDVIIRVQKGVAGADIKHEVHVDGRFCGKIVYDSKNRNDWKTKYIEQLRNDQQAEHADHAVLATRKFPQGTRELTIRDNVVLVNPARAVALARVLRDAVIQVSATKLSEEGKKEKQGKLYEFVTSTRCINQFSRFEDEVTHLREIDEREKKSQEKTRRDRAKHVGEIEKTVIGELQREIHDILGL